MMDDWLAELEREREDALSEGWPGETTVADIAEVTFE